LRRERVLALGRWDRLDFASNESNVVRDGSLEDHLGEIHEVMVVPGGFSWKEKTYPSLSAIAKGITGTSWNGPRFFGLRGKSGAKVSGNPVPIAEDAPRPSTRSSVRSMGSPAEG
jgi:hypothetical protein